MDNSIRFGQELDDAQAQLDEVLVRCAIRLKPFDGIKAANDNALFPGKSAPPDSAHGSSADSDGREIAG